MCIRPSLSQEVVRGLLYDLLHAPQWIRVEPQVLLVHMLIQFQERRLVIATVAIVGCAKNSCNVVVVLQLVARTHQLVGPCHHF